MKKSIKKKNEEYSNSDIGFCEVKLKSQIWKHFKRNKYDVCRCNHCGLLCKQLNQSTNQLFNHLSKSHSELIYGFGMSKKDEQQFLTQFTETLVLQGYPIDKILQAILKLYSNYKLSFNELVKRQLNNLPQARATIVEKLQNLPIDTDRDAVEQMINMQYPNLSHGTKQYLIQQYFWIYSSQQQIILNFKEKGYNIITQIQQQNIRVMLIVTDSMKQSYFKYADCVSIDLVEKVYKKRSPHGFSQYSCLFFTGQNQHLQNVLFGFSIVDELTQNNLEFLLKTFFKQMYNVMPLSICIPPYILLQSQIKKIDPQINIIVNWHHKLKFMSQILEQQIQCQSIMRALCQCLKSTCKQQFDFLISRIMSKVSDQDTIKYGIQNKTQLFCIFDILPKFIGFNIQIVKYLKLQKHIRQTFIYQRNLARLFIFVTKLDKKLNYQSYYQWLDETFYQNILDNIQKTEKNLHQMQKTILNSYKISKQIEERLKFSINELGTYRMQIIDAITIKIVSRKNHISKWKINIIKFHIQFDHWTCNCKFLQHTGLPCGHLIKVIQKFNGNIMYYINSRWLLPI